MRLSLGIDWNVKGDDVNDEAEKVIEETIREASSDFANDLRRRLDDAGVKNITMQVNS
jgi:hypothetical protein